MTKLATRRSSAAAALTALAVLTACAPKVDGTAQRQSSPTAGLIEILPTEQDVSVAVGSPLDATAMPKVGPISVLPNGIRTTEDASPLDCLGAATPLMRVVYESGGVQAAAWQDYSRFGKGLTVSSAEAGVVRMDSADAAARTFATFATRWKACDGTTVNMHGLELTVTRVRTSGQILTAVILSSDGHGDEFPTEHAIGVARDCIVDVDVAITDPDPTRRQPGTRAADLVRGMLTKIG